MIHGSSERNTAALLSVSVFAGATGGADEAESSRVRSAGESHNSFGCQILRKPIKQAIEISEAPTSTIQGLMKFEIRNCGIANERPQTRIAGQISNIPRRPAKAQISQNGTISEKNGNCRPTMAPSK